MNEKYCDENIRRYIRVFTIVKRMLTSSVDDSNITQKIFVESTLAVSYEFLFADNAMI